MIALLAAAGIMRSRAAGGRRRAEDAHDSVEVRRGPPRRDLRHPPPRRRARRRRAAAARVHGGRGSTTTCSATTSTRSATTSSSCSSTCAARGCPTRRRRRPGRSSAWPPTCASSPRRWASSATRRSGTPTARSSCSSTPSSAPASRRRRSSPAGCRRRATWRGPGQPRGVRADRAARAGHLVVGARGGGADPGGLRGAAARPDPVPLRRPARPAHRRVRARGPRAASRARRARHFAIAEYGAIEVEDRLGDVTHPVLVLAGRHDRTCVVEGAEAIAAGIPGAQLAVFEASGAHHVRRGERGVPERRAALPSVGAVEAIAGVAETRADVAPLVELAVDRRAEDRDVRVSERTASSPSGAATRQTKRRPLGAALLEPRSGRSALPPVASIGSTSTISASGPWSGIDS